MKTLLLVNPPECARPRAQQRPNARWCPNILQPDWLTASLRPRTGALQVSGSGREWFREILTLIALSASIATASAQSFTIDWFTIDGGGGTSSGGNFALSGTIGQHDAGGPMTGGSYSLVGGFWALPFAVQTADAPQLTIVPFGTGQARISWTPNTPGYVLQENANLNTPNWVNSPSGASNPAIVPATLPVKAYRLRRP